MSDSIAPYDAKPSQRVNLQNHNIISFEDIIIDVYGERKSVSAHQETEDSPSGEIVPLCSRFHFRKRF